MKKGYLGILDYELDYTENLMCYINQKGDFSLEAIAFSNRESLDKFLETQSLQLLLISEDILFHQEGSCEKINMVRQTIILSEKAGFTGKEGYPAIYKFQPAGAIMQEIHKLSMGGQNMSGKTLLGEPDGKNGGIHMLGVVSPWGGSGKTSLSLCMGEYLSQRERVLYLGLEPLKCNFGVKKEADISGFSDILYYAKQKKCDLISRLQSRCIRIGQVDCIVSGDDFSDLLSMGPGDVDFLCEALEQSGLYQTVIWDIG